MFAVAELVLSYDFNFKILISQQNSRAQKYLTGALDLPVTGCNGMHRITWEETCALRKALSLRVRGRAVDERCVERCRRGLARVPAQIRDGVGYDTLDMYVIERIARYYESAEYDERGAGEA